MVCQLYRERLTVLRYFHRDGLFQQVVAIFGFQFPQLIAAIADTIKQQLSGLCDPAGHLVAVHIKQADTTPDKGSPVSASFLRIRMLPKTG